MLAKASDVLKQVIAGIRQAAANPTKPQPMPRPVAQTASTTTIGDAPVTISIAQLDELRAELRAAHARHAAVAAELAAAHMADPTGRIVQLQALAREMLVIIRYAIANLPPSENPKWPAQAIERVAEGLRNLPDFATDDQVLVTELMLFACDIEEHEIDRARKRDKLIASAPAREP